jgi:hypothetical protein
MSIPCKFERLLSAFERRYTERRHACAAQSKEAHASTAVENREYFPG